MNQISIVFCTFEGCKLGNIYILFAWSVEP